MLLAPELFETDAADKYFISARINHRGQRNFPLALLFLNTASVKTLLRNSIFVRYLKYLSVHDTHPARGAGRCRDTGCAGAPMRLFLLLLRRPARAFHAGQARLPTAFRSFERLWPVSVYSSQSGLILRRCHSGATHHDESEPAGGKGPPPRGERL